MGYNDIKLEIYESHLNGDITALEKEHLLEKLESETSIEAFCERYGLIPVDDDNIYFESLRAELGQFIRDNKELREIKKNWNELAKKFVHAWKAVAIKSEKEKTKLKEAYEKLKQKEIKYPAYKKAFDTILKHASLPTNNIILENVIFKWDDKKKEDSLAVRYAQGSQRVMIPNGTRLLHVSPTKGIKELQPSFRSKTVGKYMYPSPRIFFTLAREIKPNKAGLENQKTYKYTPKQTIRFGMIDPSYTSFSVGSIFIETKNPIAVMDFNEKMKSIAFESASNKDFDADSIRRQFMNVIYEAEADGKITADQFLYLRDYAQCIR